MPTHLTYTVTFADGSIVCADSDELNALQLMRAVLSVELTQTDGDPAPAGVEIEVTDAMSAERSRACANGPGHDWHWNTLYAQYVCGECIAIGMPIDVALEDEQGEDRVVARWRKGEVTRTLVCHPSYGYQSRTQGPRTDGVFTLGTWDRFRTRWWSDDLAVQEMERLNGTAWERVGAGGGEAPK